jgi:hypothetical protein
MLSALSTTVFKNPKAMWSVDGTRSVTAVAEIAAGEVILVENAFDCSFDVMKNCVLHNAEAYDKLHPRDGVEWSDEMDPGDPAVSDLTAEKVTLNAFDSGDGRVILAVETSAANHSWPCNMRSTKVQASMIDDDGSRHLVSQFIVLHTTRAAAVGDELTICYRQSSVSLDFINTVPAAEYQAYHDNLIPKAAISMCLDYIGTTEFVSFAVMNELARLGCYCCRGRNLEKIVCTPRYLSFLKRSSASHVETVRAMADRLSRHEFEIGGPDR